MHKRQIGSLNCAGASVNGLSLCLQWPLKDVTPNSAAAGTVSGTLRPSRRHSEWWMVDSDAISNAVSKVRHAPVTQQPLLIWHVDGWKSAPVDVRPK